MDVKVLITSDAVLGEKSSYGISAYVKDIAALLEKKATLFK